jgi:hypothetical protein
MMTIVCRVYETRTRQPVQASELYRACFHNISADFDDRTGSIYAERGQRRIEHKTNRASFKVWANENRLMLTGNPTRWLQGHAAFCDLDPVLVAMRAYVQWRAFLSAPGFTIIADHFSTIHLAHMFLLDTKQEARDTLDSFVFALVKGRAIRKLMEDGLYFGKGSKRKSMKLYIDALKMVCGKRRSDVMGRYIRIEIVLHTDEVRRVFGSTDKKQLEVFKRTDLRDVIDAELKQLKYLSSQHRINDFPANLSDSEVGVLQRWSSNKLGRDPSELRYFRQRILAKTGIDITQPPSPVELTQRFERQPLRDFFRTACATDKVPAELRLKPA